ncbi:MAG: hypothetical protein KDK96_07070 [Chlamydiia bacterium]|nr:hypothetical protein [Chlamydiia bacterium]
MAGYIRAVASMGAGATAFNLMGNLGVRTVSKWAPSYSGAVLAGISSTAFFVLGHMTKDKVIPDRSDPYSDGKRNLYILTVTFIGGTALPHLLAPLTKSKISLIASLGYSILSYFGTIVGLSVLGRLADSTSFSEGFKEFMDKHIKIWDYLQSSKA